MFHEKNERAVESNKISNKFFENFIHSSTIAQPFRYKEKLSYNKVFHLKSLSSYAHL